MMESDPPRLEAIQIGRRAPATGTWLLRDVSLALRAGERVVVAGPTGSGKTLLLRSLALLDRLDAGQVRWRGAAVCHHRVPTFRSRVICLQQRPALVEGTVLDNLRYPFTLAVHRERQFDGVRVTEWLQALGRDAEFLQKSNRDLSGGEAQITALLRAMQLQPEILLLDEPTAALDADTVQAMEQCVTRWFQELPQERTIVWVSHSQGQATRMADRLIRMEDGRIVAGA